MGKNLIVGFCLMFFCLSCSKAQPLIDTIQIKKGVFGTIYLKGDKSIGNGKGLNKLLRSNPETNAEIKLMRTNLIFSIVFGCTSGYIFGYQLTSRYTRSKPNWGALSAATALLGLSIPFELGRVKHLKSAVLIYNNGLMQTGKNEVRYNLLISNNGAGLKVNF
ncbi:hypothetical protein [Pedobacter arcticus]|uniref:hypothetical protein n=1 Tax=Pedobacter arcticus TaxID=752140 RepID=UPI00037DA0E1|nr:hypothetical protein [Pedobacter arcticus]